MNDDGRFDALLAVLADMAASLRALTELVPAPNYRFSLQDFPAFDWSEIGAEVVATDKSGVSVVRWRNQTYKRRAPSNAYTPAIYFSRATGKDEGGTRYERLITFAEAGQGAKVRSVPEETRELLPVGTGGAVVGGSAGMGGSVERISQPAPDSAPAVNGKKAPVSQPAVQPATSQVTQPAAGTMVVRIIRIMPLQPADLKRFIAQEAEHARAATPAQTGAVHQALVKVIPDEAVRRRFQAWLTGHESMSNWTPQEVLAVHSWLKPSAGNGPTDKWCQKEIDMAMDLLRPMAAADPSRFVTPEP